MKTPLCILSFIATATSAQFAFAFCFVPQPRLVCSEYFRSQLVVEATMIKAKNVTSKRDPEGIDARVYSLKIDRVFRGNSKAMLYVYEGNDSGRAPFDWNPGAKYLLFLSVDSPHNAWNLDGCGNSGPIEASGHAIAEIENIKAAPVGGTISGVVSGQLFSIPIAGIRVEAQGSAGHYTAITSKNGEFSIKVPAGSYSLQAISPSMSFEKADISYEDPKLVKIEPGGCAQVQFAQADKRR
jgi:Carboxypeptidase regulatory-like domain